LRDKGSLEERLVEVIVCHGKERMLSSVGSWLSAVSGRGGIHLGRGEEGALYCSHLP